MNPLTLRKYPYADVDQAVSASEQVQWSTIVRVNTRDQRFAMLPRIHINSFMQSHHYVSMCAEDRNYVRALVPEIMNRTTTDLTDRANRMETIRNGIPVDGLLEEAIAVVKTGAFSDGTPLKAADRAKLMMQLVHKALPDAKSVDGLLMQQRMQDERTAQLATKLEDISKLTREQLLSRLVESEPPKGATCLMNDH